MNLEILRDKISKASDMEIELIWLPKIMGRQTKEEKDARDTIDNNGVGLNVTDAPYCTRVYEQVLSQKHLTVRQANILRKILPKYCRQYNKMLVCSE